MSRKIHSDNLNLNDNQTDLIIRKNDKPFIEKRNSFDIYDSNGNKIYTGYNVVVNTGRLYTAQTLFNKSIDNTIGRNNNPNQWVSVFSIGKGGAPSSAPLAPIYPEVTDTELVEKLKFYPEDTTRQYEDNDSSKPRYWNGTDFKDINSLSIVQDSVNNNTYCEMVLKIGFSEAKGEYINEIGVYLADHSLSGTGLITNKTNFILFSRFTFPSLPKSSNDNTDEYTINYRVYC
jgi:hypothetical protein